ncbi:serine/threonine-protein kinase [Nocardioides antri]|uniref:serine/threonine-protein kinase n=1 Tax=Nocardioides antri TaxID=2607659 RepID=UPI001CB6ECD3|nr:serine/threonine-protein kinase [Nocardioides antri]
MTLLADRYRLGDLLGRGGVADVYRARDQVLDRDVAVKVLRETVDDVDRDRFMGEARLLARLSHPGLVTVLDTGVWGMQPFLVMELVEGSPLSAALSEGPLPLDRVGDVGAQLAAVLAYAHAQDVVHRDVKPANVLLGPRGELKLADFGIARLVGDMVRHTKTGTTIGTPAYVSPEQARGAPVGPPTDVYSLGLVLIEALTGERCFTGTPIESALARLHRAPDIPEDLPADWRELLAAMTAMDPADRPTAAEVASRIQGSGAPPAATRVLEVGSAVAPVGAAAVGADDAPTERMDPSSGAVPGRSLKAVAAVAAAALVVVALSVAGLLLGDGAQDDDGPGPPATSPATTGDTEPEEQDTGTVSDGVQDETSPPVDQPDDGDDREKDNKDKDKGDDKDTDKGKGEGNDKNKNKGGGKGKG